ncbi:MAG: glycogen-binding domain-containing protein [Rhodothermaceae bacterium]|nr:glycogen-binding domain-containing protein [Rhodothermaceae bacterium]
MICTISISEASARQFQSRFTMGTTGGYTTNTYLSPILSEWDRSGTSAAFFNASRLLSANVSLAATAGLSHLTSGYTRDLQWILAGIDWLATPFTKVEIRAGSNWRSYSDLTDSDNLSNRYDSYGIEAEHWISHKWQLLGRFYSSLDHITDPGRGFSTSAGLTRQWRSGLSVTAQTGFERYSQQFQPEGGVGIMPPRGGQQTLTIEDHFVRSGLSVRYPVMRNISLHSRVANLLWMSNTDNSVLSDYELSAGVQVSFSPVMAKRGVPYRVRWEIKPDSKTIIEVLYKGNESLYLTGDFNDWDQPGIPLERTGRNRYRATLDAGPGIYQYKILTRQNGDLEWLDLSGQAPTVDDGFGGRNGRVIIEAIQ